MTAKRMLDHVEHASEILRQLHVPEAQHAEARLLEQLRSMLITLDSLRMLTTIELDDQTRFEALEVGDVTDHGDLPPKLPAAELASAQFPPQQLLDVGRRPAQLTGDRHLALGRLPRPAPAAPQRRLRGQM